MTIDHDKEPAATDAELAALGEPPAGMQERDVEGDPDVRTVATLVAIANTDVASAPPLSELSRRRVWAKLEGRIAAAGLAQHHAISAHMVADPAATAANAGPGWRSVLAGLAVAAVLILPRLSAVPDPGASAGAASSPAQRQARVAEGEALRQAVSGLGNQGESRARDLASGYAARLSNADGGERP